MERYDITTHYGIIDGEDTALLIFLFPLTRLGICLHLFSQDVLMAPFTVKIAQPISSLDSLSRILCKFLNSLFSSQTLHLREQFVMKQQKEVV
jgi:hypothetical protein